MGLGAGDGSSVVGTFSDSLLDNNKVERGNTNDMFERYLCRYKYSILYNNFIVICRETRRERILENLKKTWKIREKQLKMIGSIDISREGASELIDTSLICY